MSAELKSAIEQASSSSRIQEEQTPPVISIRGAGQHNLKQISLDIPKNRLVVITGKSGSGKSTLAFDTLHKEGQRQYLESLGMVTDDLTKPVLKSISGLSPSISVDQHQSNRSPRSTVGTVTEVYTYLRVLFARLGTRPCPHCAEMVSPYGQSSDKTGVEPDLPANSKTGGPPQFPCTHCGGLVAELGMEHFSFNKPDGACPTCTGLGLVRTVDLTQLIDFSLGAATGGVVSWDKHEIKRYRETLVAAGQYYGFDFEPEKPIGELSPTCCDLLFYGVGDNRFKRHFPQVEPPTTVAKGRFEGIATNLLRRYEEQASNTAYRQKLEKKLLTSTCSECGGARIQQQSVAVQVAAKNIVQVSQMPLVELHGWVENLGNHTNPNQRSILDPIVDDLSQRIQNLLDVGVGYLSLDRASPSLSAGESQRLRLACLLGSSLTGVLYVLDEPSIGLHPRDTRALIAVLKKLRDLGNTVVVVEHDQEIMEAADHLIDIGPQAGSQGGQLVYAGPPQQIHRCEPSITGAYLSGAQTVPVPKNRRRGNGKQLRILGASAHNLQNINVEIPLAMLVGVTGVSGSGKSTLILEVLEKAARRHFYAANSQPGEVAAIQGLEHLDGVVTINQMAIGKTPRSNAATYCGAYAGIREVFAATRLAAALGLTASHFSFNISGGRCEHCQGAGTLTVNMHFLPDAQVPCPQCRGRRFGPDVLQVQYQGLSIDRVLQLTIQEAAGLFRDKSSIAGKLNLLTQVGLGYLQLGQPATTLSGGEAQRVKLAKELSRRQTGRTLYLLDEPTTGLHMDDVAQLLLVLQQLVERGNTVVVIEHCLDLVRASDWLLDLGPEGGAAGGKLLASGTPERVAQVAESRTGQFLRIPLGC